MAARPVHPLVAALAQGLKAPAIRSQNVQMGSAAAFARASNLPEIVVFAGFVGDLVTRGNDAWQILYVDLALTEWLLIEDVGIVEYARVRDDAVPKTFNGERDVLWVKADAAVGRGHASQSLEGQFLTGEFTRAADFEAPLTGGTLAAATGVFCEARTPSCCRYYSRPRP
jgi:hypothetical protein